MTDLALRRDGDAEIIEAVVVGGDLSKLTPAQRVQWYRMRCESAGMDPRTQPFQYLSLQGKLTLYATRTATDQLRKVNGVSCEIAKTETVGDVYCVTVRATDVTGRSDSEMGAVNVKGLTGDALANALMKAITKAKRRATLSICGLGMLDETEVETIPGATTVPMEPEPSSVAPEGNGGQSKKSHHSVIGSVWTGKAQCPRCGVEPGEKHVDPAQSGADVKPEGDPAHKHQRRWFALTAGMTDEANRMAMNRLLGTDHASRAAFGEADYQQACDLWEAETRAAEFPE